MIDPLAVPWVALIRIGLAAVICGAVGLEREMRGRQAGWRTNILMGVGSALAMIISISFPGHLWNKAVFDITVTNDPARMAYGVMTGIGLLCAGVIIKDGWRISGMTTAASLWCSCALGLGCGLGLYTVAVGTGILVIGVLWILQYAEAILPRTKFAQITVQRNWSTDCVQDTIRKLASAGLSVTDLHFHRSFHTPDVVKLHLRVGFVGRKSFYQLVQKIEADANIHLLGGQNL